ncbi:hypothetical protein EPO05_05190, partial [Patescibacteria group bacterium]
MDNLPMSAPELRIPPMRNIPTSVPPGAPSGKSRGMLLGLMVGGIVLILGGGYFAYAQGYISLPFLPSVKNKNVDTVNTTAHQNQNTQQSGTNQVANSNTSVGAKLGAMPVALGSWNGLPFGDISFGANSNNGAGGYVLHPALRPAPQTLAAGTVACDAVAPKATLELGKNYCYMDLAAGFRAASVCEKTSNQATALSGST